MSTPPIFSYTADKIKVFYEETKNVSRIAWSKGKEILAPAKRVFDSIKFESGYQFHRFTVSKKQKEVESYFTEIEILSRDSHLPINSIKYEGMDPIATSSLEIPSHLNSKVRKKLEQAVKKSLEKNPTIKLNYVAIAHLYNFVAKLYDTESKHKNDPNFSQKFIEKYLTGKSELFNAIVNRAVLNQLKAAGQKEIVKVITIDAPEMKKDGTFDSSRIEITTIKTDSKEVETLLKILQVDPHFPANNLNFILEDCRTRETISDQYIRTVIQLFENPLDGVTDTNYSQILDYYTAAPHLLSDPKHQLNPVFFDKKLKFSSVLAGGEKKERELENITLPGFKGHKVQTFLVTAQDNLHKETKTKKLAELKQFYQNTIELIKKRNMAKSIPPEELLTAPPEKLLTAVEAGNLTSNLKNLSKKPKELLGRLVDFPEQIIEGKKIQENPFTRELIQQAEKIQEGEDQIQQITEMLKKIDDLSSSIIDFNENIDVAHIGSKASNNYSAQVFDGGELKFNSGFSEFCDAGITVQIGKTTLLITADGNGWQSGTSAQIAVKETWNFIHSHLENTGEVTANDLLKIFYLALQHANQKIMEYYEENSAGTTTTINITAISQDENSKNHLLTCNLGDSSSKAITNKGLVDQERENLEIDPLSIRDCYGRIGGDLFSSIRSEDLKNISFYHTENQDVVISATDGFWDNLSPFIHGKTKNEVFSEEERQIIVANKENSLPFQIPDQEIEEKYGQEMAANLKKSIAKTYHKEGQKILKEWIESSEKDSFTASEFAVFLTEKTYESTQKSRDFYQNPKNDRQSPNNYKEYPGKDDHTLIQVWFNKEKMTKKELLNWLS